MQQQEKYAMWKDEVGKHGVCVWVVVGVPGCSEVGRTHGGGVLRGVTVTWAFPYLLSLRSHYLLGM